MLDSQGDPRPYTGAAVVCQLVSTMNNDPASLAGAALGLLLLAIVVSFAATWRIARLDPAETLRQE